MQTVEEYRKNAADCRELAKTMQNPDDRKALETMAEVWDRLAQTREGKLLAGLEPDDV